MLSLIRRLFRRAPPHLRGRVPVDCGVGTIDHRSVADSQQIYVPKRPEGVPSVCDCTGAPHAWERGCPTVRSFAPGVGWTEYPDSDMHRPENRREAMLRMAERRVPTSAESEEWRNASYPTRRRYEDLGLSVRRQHMDAAIREAIARHGGDRAEAVYLSHHTRYEVRVFKDDTLIATTLSEPVPYLTDQEVTLRRLFQ